MLHVGVPVKNKFVENTARFRRMLGKMEDVVTIVVSVFLVVVVFCQVFS